MALDDFLNGVQTLAIVCNQWGDTGKGKFVDWFAEWADIIARGTGGANAGHTIRIGDKEYIVHLVPSGILHDSQGKINILGSGVAFDPRVMKGELELLSREGVTYNNLMISQDAALVLPHHILLDRLQNSAHAGTKIGTTGRGIGPTYEDDTGRRGLVVNDMLNKDDFVRKLKENLDRARLLLADKDPEAIKKVMHVDVLGEGMFYDPKNIFNVDAIVATYTDHGRFFKDLVSDTDEFVRSRAGKSRILLEGAQGTLLSKKYGTKPHNTASDSSITGLAQGVGLPIFDGKVLGIVKAPYITRVGEGEFPTEFGREKSPEWCRDHKKEDEEREYPNANVNSTDEFEQGVGIRMVGAEYGATTKRARRTGWLDLPLLRYAARINGRNVALTKVDVLDECKRIKICESYVYEGPDHQVGKTTLRKGDRLTVGLPYTEVLQHCRPVYREFDGWMSKTSDVRNYEDLPRNLKNIVEFIEQSADVNAAIVSVGPDRNQTVVRDLK
jgi:adenylosuccinate synthase